ncbi:MAG: UDP-GlcNAc--UDP-phosphate GlcNAc-1-phosphate transferase [Flavobacteriaceae bacterium]|nr:UDP-GlcNAc--UDP-phosphate GlcNAc-1-phosphate transferase [Flavobacteriaceae bacterium]
MMIYHIIIFCTLFVLETIYIKVARIKNIKDDPNHRSAHSTPIIRGGGIVVFFSVFLYLFFFNADANFLYFLSGIVLVSVISFVDDLIMLSSKVRLIVHFIAFSLIFYSLELFNFSSALEMAVLLIVYLFSIGFLNIYNFMDGINGITFLNGLASYSTLLYLNEYYLQFTDSNLLIVLILAIVVFGFFNFRKNAICFAGDIGSIAIGFSLIYFVLKLYLDTKNLLVLLVFLVYLLDGGLTIIERAYRKEDVFQAHKRHLYQLAVNDFKIGHLKIASIYFVLQLVINVLLIIVLQITINKLLALTFIVISFTMLYVVIKYKLIKQLNKTHEN